MKKYTLAAISTQGKESIFLNLTTPIRYGGQKQFTTECIILDKVLAAVSESGAVQKMSCYLKLPSSILDLLTLITLSGVSVWGFNVCVCVCVNFDTGSWSFFCSSVLMQV